MKVTSKIEGVQDFEILAEHTQWARDALRAAQRRLGWSSIQTSLVALESGFAGRNDGYNLSANALAEYSPYNFSGGTLHHGRIGWVVLGGCGYGSSIEVRSDGFCITSCGGHWVSGRWGIYNTVIWDCDDLPSQCSWGDTPNGEPVDKAARIASLQAAMRGE